MEEYKENERATDVYSKRVKAGKRTYFFDVKSTRGSDFYLTITESKKRFKDNGFYYEKHKVFLYKEDFKKFLDSLEEAVAKIKELMPDYDFDQVHEEEEYYSGGNREAAKEETYETLEASASEDAQDTDLKWE